jgi:putative ABC transport system permease protein
MGVTNLRLVQMILLQGLLVGGSGYGIGVGLTALFFIATNQVTVLAGLHMTWLAFAGTGAAVLLIITLTSLASMRKVLFLEPAIVFRG